MTRSFARRQNGNARRIVASIPVDRLEGKAFDSESARRFATTWRSTHFVPGWSLDEVNWPYTAELLNRKARQGLIDQWRNYSSAPGDDDQPHPPLSDAMLRFLFDDPVKMAMAWQQLGRRDS